jgi:hypothetical protein
MIGFLLLYTGEWCDVFCTKISSVLCMVDRVSHLIVVEAFVLEISQLGCMGCNNSKNFNWQFSTLLPDNFICCVNYFDVPVWRPSTFGKTKSLGA